MTKSEMYSILSCNSDEDLLRIFPSKYESLITTPIDINPEENKRYVFKGTPTKVKAINKYRNDVVRFTLKVYNTEINCLLYKQPFYFPKLVKSELSLFVLYYNSARKYYVVNAIYDIDSFYSLSGIKPCYSLTKKVSPSFFYSQIKKILQSDLIYSYKWKVPTKYANKYKLIQEGLAYKFLHLPKNDEEKDKALRVFKYEEALTYFINALKTKKDIQEIKTKEQISISHDKINDFVKSLPYKLTKDQNVAIREIVTDMEKTTRMYRLLQGDVSTGKTIVAFVSLYANYLRNKQGVIIAPTFELAKQHYDNIQKVFNNFNINITFCHGNLTKKEKADIITKLNSGEIDIAIGTHALITDSVGFNNLGLAIIDEQQLFGVKQREELLSKGKSCDLLMMSATPIPRTLSQTINSDLEVSTLKEFPSGSRNVETKLVHSSDPIIFQAIDKALKASRQVFIVAPKIDEGNNNTLSVNEIYQIMIDKYSVDKVAMMHGKMKKDERDEVYKKFLSGEKPILVSTTVIEVGIDVTSAGLLIIYNANYFGLSSLHQLRGRIGRSGKYSLAILVYDGKEKEAKEKLEFLVNNNDGLLISEYDLQMRGSGEYGGEKQSGNSFLKITNFVLDQKIFQVAKIDAQEIIDNLNDKENKEFYDYAISFNQLLA